MSLYQRLKVKEAAKNILEIESDVIKIGDLVKSTLANSGSVEWKHSTGHGACYYTVVSTGIEVDDELLKKVAVAYKNLFHKEKLELTQANVSSCHFNLIANLND